MVLTISVVAVVITWGGACLGDLPTENRLGVLLEALYRPTTEGRIWSVKALNWSLKLISNIALRVAFCVSSSESGYSVFLYVRMTLF